MVILTFHFTFIERLFILIDAALQTNIDIIGLAWPSCLRFSGRIDDVNGYQVTSRLVVTFIVETSTKIIIVREPLNEPFIEEAD